MCYSNTSASPLIHIGYPKTATTWFQKYFYPNMKNISIVSRNKIDYLIFNKNSFTFNGQEVKKEIYNEHKKRIVLCEERIVVDRRNCGILLVEKAQRLKKIFPDGKIVVFIRNQLDMLASQYSQHLKSGGNYSINRYLFDSDINMAKQNFFVQYEYNYIIEKYKELFGSNNVCVFLFEDFQNDPQGFLLEYIKRLNLETDIKEIKYQKKINIRYKKFMIPFVRLFNTFTSVNFDSSFQKKRCLIHIPFLFTVVHFIFDQVNMFLNGNPSYIDILGERNAKILYEFYAESNKNLVEQCPEIKRAKLERYGYPL